MKKKGFRFQVEFCPNQNVVVVHATKMFPRAETDPMMRDCDKPAPKGNRHPLIKSIRRLKGVLSVGSERFELCIEKAELFGWEEILPKVRTALKKHFADGEELDEIPARKLSAEVPDDPRGHGCDV